MVEGDALAIVVLFIILLLCLHTEPHAQRHIRPLQVVQAILDCARGVTSLQPQRSAGQLAGWKWGLGFSARRGASVLVWMGGKL